MHFQGFEDDLVRSFLLIVCIFPMKLILSDIIHLKLIYGLPHDPYLSPLVFYSKVPYIWWLMRQHELLSNSSKD